MPAALLPTLRSLATVQAGGVQDGVKLGRIVVIDAPGLGPADLSTIPYKNAPLAELYPLGKKD